MASVEPAMTPAQALETVASVRAYRERLTGRAAGLVWMVWGFAFTLLAAGDLATLAASPDWVDGAGQREGWGIRTDAAAVGSVVLFLGVLLAAGLVTNAVWRAHALEHGVRYHAWVTWAAVTGLVLAGGLAGIAIVAVLGQTTDLADPSTPDGMQVLMMPLVAAVGAGIITVLQRRRVAWLPGALAATVLTALQVVLPLTVDVARLSLLVTAVQAGMVGILAIFVATGLWYYKRG